MAADCQHANQAKRWQHIDRGQEAAADLGSVKRHGPDLISLTEQLARLHAFGAETLDDANPRDGFFDHGGQRCLTVLHRHHGGMNLAAESARRQVDQRQWRQRNKRQQRVACEEQHQNRGNLKQVADGERNHHHERLQLLQIARGSAHQLTRLGVIVIPNIESDDVVEQPFTQHSLGATAFAKRQPAPP